MRTKVRRVGTSLGVLLPADLCRRLELREGDGLFASPKGGAIVLSREPRDPGLEGFLRRIRPLFGKSILRAYIYGSYATGKFRRGRSDIDLFIVARRGRAREVQERVLKAAFAVTRGGGEAPISPVVVDEEEFDEGWFDYEVKPGYALYDTALSHPAA